MVSEKPKIRSFEVFLNGFYNQKNLGFLIPPSTALATPPHCGNSMICNLSSDLASTAE